MGWFNYQPICFLLYRVKEPVSHRQVWVTHPFTQCVQFEKPVTHRFSAVTHRVIMISLSL